MKSIEFTGRRGSVTVNTTQQPRIATKKALEKHHHAAIQKEAEILKKLNNYAINRVPQVISIEEGQFSYERIQGERFDKVFPEQDTKTQKKLAQELLAIAFKLDTLGIVHGELDKPMSNVLVNTNRLAHNQSGTVALIDFERGTWHDYSGKNLRQLIQRIARQGYISRDECKQWGRSEPEELYHLVSQRLMEQTDLHHKKHALLGIVILILFDQLTKYVFYDLARGSSFVLLTPILNTGIGRSIPLPQRTILLLSVIVLCIIGQYIWKIGTTKAWIVLFFAGGVGNLIDRLLFAGVRDFIDLQYRPIFNLADIYLTIAACRIIRNLIRNKELL